MRAYPGFVNPVCRGALAQYMRFMYVPTPRSIYKNVFKLEPGCMISIKGYTLWWRPHNHFALQQFSKSELTRWWSLADVVQNAACNPIKNEIDAINELEQRLSNAVKLQSLADVPLGAFLSGGVDSSAIVALMQKETTSPVKLSQ